MRQRKQDAVYDVPKDLILPKLDADFTEYEAEDELIDLHAGVRRAQTNYVDADNEMFLIESYFDNMLKILNILNELMSDGKDVIGFEVESLGCIHHVFPGMEGDEDWVNQTCNCHH